MHVPAPDLRRLVLLAAAGAVLLLALGTRMLAVGELDPDFDEDDYLRAGQLYATGLQAGDPGVFLRENYRPEHPPLSKIVTGLAIAPLAPAPEIPDAPITAEPNKDLPEPHLTVARTAGAVFGALTAVPSGARVAARRAVAGAPHLEHQVLLPGDARGGPGVLRPACRAALDAGVATRGDGAPQGGLACCGRDRVRARLCRQVPVRRGRTRHRRGLGAAGALDRGGRGSTAPRHRADPRVPRPGCRGVPGRQPVPVAGSRRPPHLVDHLPRWLRGHRRRPGDRLAHLAAARVAHGLGAGRLAGSLHVRRRGGRRDHRARRDRPPTPLGRAEGVRAVAAPRVRVPARLAIQVAAVHPGAVRPAVSRRGPRDGEPAAAGMGSASRRGAP